MYYFNSNAGVIMLSDKSFPGIVYGFGTKDSESKVAHLVKARLVLMNQMHGTNIKAVDSVQASEVPDADGMISKAKNLMLCVRTADCVPIIFIDDRQKVVGAVHAGWKGTLSRIAERAVSNLLEHGAKKNSLHALIGPSIGACCYRIHGEREKMFRSEFKSWDGIIEDRFDHHTLNLRRLNYMQLSQAGIQSTQIYHTNFCTACDSKRFYSYNRDKTTFRMTSFVGIEA